MPHNLVPLTAFLLLIGGGTWFFTKAPPPPPPELPPCDAPAQTEALLSLLADPATTIVHETREPEIAASMSLAAPVEIPQSASASGRLCDTTLHIAARGERPANAYDIRYMIDWRRDDRDAADVRIGDIRRTQLPPCDTPELFDAAARLAGIGRERSVGSGAAFSDIAEISFDFAAQKRRCAGHVRDVLQPPIRTRGFTGTVSWANRDAGTLMIEMQVE